MEQLIRSASQLGSAVRFARRQKNLSQTELGDLTGLRQATISNLEKGDGAVKAVTLFSVLAALDIELVVRDRTQASSKDIEDIF